MSNMANTKRLTEKVEVLSHGTQGDGYGGYIPTVTVEDTISVHIEQMQAGKDIEQAQITLPGTYRMISRKDVTAGQTIRWNGKEYAITSTPQADHVRRTRYYHFTMHVINK